MQPPYNMTKLKFIFPIVNNSTRNGLIFKHGGDLATFAMPAPAPKMTTYEYQTHCIIYLGETWTISYKRL